MRMSAVQSTAMSSRRRPPRSVWNRLGFWLIHEEFPPSALPVRTPEKASAAWVGVPSVLPVLAAGLGPWLVWRRERAAGRRP